MKLRAEIFSQGEEVVSGQILDSNAAWLSRQLAELGFKVKRHTAVGDNLDDLIVLLKEIAVRADCCICTGGLGPTIDDLTAEAVSMASGQALHCDEQAVERIRHYFACRDRPMPETNRKQAYLPETAVRIDNAFGTAPGFALQFQRCWFVFLPGVPSEMERMFTSLVRQQLIRRFTLQPDCLVTLRSIGIGESAIQQCLEALVLPPSVQLGFRATSDEVQTKLLFPAGYSAQEKQGLAERVAELIGDYVFAIDGLHGPQGDLLEVISHLMQEKGHTLAVLETASQGLIAAKCIARRWLHAADICLDLTQIAHKWPIKIDENDLSGATRDLAAQLRERWQTGLALAQLYGDEDADYNDKDRTVVLYNALCTEDGIFISRNKLAGAIEHKQNQAAMMALDLLRRYLQNKCL